MKRYILSTVAGGLLIFGSAFAQSTQTPAPGSTQTEAERHAGRVENQKDRIQQGVKSGDLTKGQARAMGRNMGRINHEAQNMKAKNGGQLNQRQEARIHNQMNRSSRRVYRAKH